jgi:hypothetical protein
LLSAAVEKVDTAAPITLRAPVPPEVLCSLALAAPGWPQRIGVAGIEVRADRDGYRVAGPGIDTRADDPWEAANWVLAAAIGQAAEAIPGRFVLNAGAALIADRAVAFAGESHAGKSSLALHLAAIGVPMLGDDRLIVDTAAVPPSITALGLARKVRVPLPSDFAPAARRLAWATRVGHGGGADVLAWDPAVDRPAGRAAPIAGILLLHRDPAVHDARLDDPGPAEAVATLLSLCGRHAGGAAELLDMVAALVHRVPVQRLSAPDSATAASALLAARRR